MIDLDFGPGALAGVIVIAFLFPMLYSFFVDNYDRKSPQIKAMKVKR